jgi:CBS domain-containing protein
MRAADIMTRDPVCVTPVASARDAARRMEEWDCGMVPVVDDLTRRRVLGVVTDRDLAIRVLAQGRLADASVGEIMTEAPDCVTPDADIDQVERLMADRQLRRVIVIDDTGRCVGVIAQADLARASRAAPRDVSHFEVARVLERISEPETATASGSSGTAPARGDRGFAAEDVR